MSLSILSPSTISGIKRIAKAIKKEQSVSHARALDLAAKLGGYENYRHALHVLGSPPISTIVTSTPRRALVEQFSLSADWGKPGMFIQRETITLNFSRPVSDWLNTRERRTAIANFRRKDAHHLQHDITVASQDQARWYIGKAARLLQFIEATGLIPASSKEVKELDIAGLPCRDHYRHWKHRATGAVVVTDEPYLNAVKDEVEERAVWAAQNDLLIAPSLWAGMHNPSATNAGTRLYLLTAAVNQRVLNTITERLNKLADPVTEDQWDDEHPHWSTTTSDINRRLPSERKTRSINAVPYQFVLGGPSTRPRGEMSIEAHLEVAEHIKAVLALSSYRTGLLKSLNSLRCVLDDWLQCEYDEKKLPSKLFHTMYYGDVNSRLSRSISEGDRTNALQRLERVKLLLRQHYRESVPLRKVLRYIDRSMKSLAEWEAKAA